MLKEKQAVDTDYQAAQVWLLNIQCKLYAWSRGHPSERWREMWNWVIHPHNLRLAWRRVASNRGARTAGVDKVTVRRIEQRIGVERFLTDLREQLRNGSYHPSPVRRVKIPKRGKPGEFRPLGVPTVADRVVQAAVLHLLEPIFEAGFYPVSYGFRPKRACRDALEHIRIAIRPPKIRGEPRRLHSPYQWVIEGDIKGCFDTIDHHSVMERLRRRVGDAKVCRLVHAFLKAGVLSEDALFAPLPAHHRAESSRRFWPTSSCRPSRSGMSGSSRRAEHVTARRTPALEMQSASSATGSARRDARFFYR